MSKLTAEIIVLPVNPGLRDAYSALLKSMYIEELDDFWLDDIINTISLDCGISVETARDRFKQLIRFKLIKYIYSSLCGHRYRILVFSKITTKDDKEVAEILHVDNWYKFYQLIKNQFKEVAETDLVRIRKTMNIQEGSGMGAKAEREVELEANLLEQAKPIYAGQDIIKSEFKTFDKQSREESSGNDGSTLDNAVLGER